MIMTTKKLPVAWTFIEMGRIIFECLPYSIKEPAEAACACQVSLHIMGWAKLFSEASGVAVRVRMKSVTVGERTQQCAGRVRRAPWERPYRRPYCNIGLPRQCGS